jgi:hypothetical protein
MLASPISSSQPDYEAAIVKHNVSPHRRRLGYMTIKPTAGLQRDGGRTVLTKLCLRDIKECQLDALLLPQNKA